MSLYVIPFLENEISQRISMSQADMYALLTEYVFPEYFRYDEQDRKMNEEKI